MGTKIKAGIIGTVLIAFALILQSTLLRLIAIYDVIPDLSLIILIFLASRQGSMVGEVSGFATGLIEDFISLPMPIGFHALLKACIGFFFGFIEGGMIVDQFFMPILLILIATVLKVFLSWILTVVFPIGVMQFFLTDYRFYIELVYNAVFTPVLFRLLNLIPSFKIVEKEKRAL
jgi:rod shape-determining protein MreD